MKETALKIRIIGDEVLTKKAKAIKEVTDYHREILSAMARLMYESSGVGLAAPQVGISGQMVVIDVGRGLYKLINAKIVKKHGSQVMEEGCLSVPGIGIRIKRAKKIWLEALDENGKPVKIEAEDLFARACQHELDHLCGKLIVDYASLIDKIKIKKRLKNLKQNLSNCACTYSPCPRR